MENKESLKSALTQFLNSADKTKAFVGVVKDNEGKGATCIYGSTYDILVLYRRLTEGIARGCSISPDALTDYACSTTKMAIDFAGDEPDYEVKTSLKLAKVLAMASLEDLKGKAVVEEVHATSVDEALQKLRELLED